MNRYRRRVDTQHKPVMDALRAAGWEVEDVHTGPLCDLVAWVKGEPGSVRLIEVKTVKTASTGRTVPTESQKALAKRGCPIVTVSTVDQALALR